MISTIRSASPSSLTSIFRAQRSYTQSIERLNNGYVDKPDQVARSVKLESQRREVIQRRLNQNQLQSLVQTADAALNEITPALYRLHELALRGLNTVISDEERSLIHDEARELESWVNASVTSAHFNSKSLFDTHLNLQTLDDAYQLKTAFNLDPLLKTHVPNRDHEIVLIFDSSRSLRNVDELFSKIVETAQRYQLKEGEVSIGVAFTPIVLLDRGGQTPGLREMAYHPPVSITEDPQGENLKSLQDFLNAYNFGIGQINFGDAIGQVHDQTEWREDAAQSLVVITTAKGENNKNTISEEIERFMSTDSRRHVSAVGVPDESTYFNNLIEQLNSGHYYDYSNDLAFDDIVTAASGETRLIPEVNLSDVFYAEDTMTLVMGALDKVITARGQLGAIEGRLEVTIDRYLGDEISLEANVERGEVQSSQEALAQRINSEFRLKQAIKYQRAEDINHWRRFLDIVNANA